MRRGVSLTETPPGHRPSGQRHPLDRDLPRPRTSPWTEAPPPDRDILDKDTSWTDTRWTETPRTETPLWTENPTPGQRTPPRTESQTGVKTLPCRNFVAGGKKPHTFMTVMLLVTIPACHVFVNVFEI